VRRPAKRAGHSCSDDDWLSNRWTHFNRADGHLLESGHLFPLRLSPVPVWRASPCCSILGPLEPGSEKSPHLLHRSLGLFHYSRGRWDRRDTTAEACGTSLPVRSSAGAMQRLDCYLLPDLPSVRVRRRSRPGHDHHGKLYVFTHPLERAQNWTDSLSAHHSTRTWSAIPRSSRRPTWRTATLRGAIANTI
jgi:hypothetical protein